jgi:bacterioferritin
MKGDKKVIDQLNIALCGELTAIVQYMTQSEMCQNWGYTRLGNLTKARAIEEMKHAEGLIERIMYLDGTPQVAVSLKPLIGASVPEQFAYALKDETSASREYNEAAKICSAAKDEGSKVLFQHMLHDEERHADFLEAQLGAIKEMGLGNYLAQQLKA